MLTRHPRAHPRTARDRRSNAIVVLALTVLGTVAVTAPATTLRVPLDEPDLPAAITVAADGDTIAVAASHVTTGGLTVPGRSLVILGGWNDAFTTVVGSSEITAAADGASLAVAPPGTGSPTIADFVIAPGPGQTRNQPPP